MWSQGLQAWTLEQLVQRLATVQTQVKDEWKDKPLAPAKHLDEIGPADRDRTVKWLMQLTLHFQFYPDTFFLSVNILDRFVTSVKAHPKYLRCIGITCLYLASKMVEEEEIIPCTKDLIETSLCGCRTGDVLRMERIILEKLSWDLCTTTSLQYLHVFHAIACKGVYDPKHSQRNLQKLTHALVRVVSQYPILVSFPSSVLALAVFSVDLEVSCNPEWVNITLQMQALANIDTDVVMKCRMVVRRYVLSTRPMSNIQQNNSAFVLNVPNLNNAATVPLQKDNSQPQVCGKRKASSEMIWQETDADSSSKKVYTNISSDIEDDGGESDATLTASEGEDNYDDENDESRMMDENDSGCVVDVDEDESGNRQPTYAEIVKLKGPWLNCKGRPPHSPQPPPLVYQHSDDDGDEDRQGIVENCCSSAASSSSTNASVIMRHLAAAAQRA